MTTAVASPPSFQSLPRLGWNGGSTTGGGFSAMSTDEVSRIFMPQRKTVQRSTSSSSLSSTGSASSTVTITQEPSSILNGDNGHAGKKKARGGFWPVSKAESTSGITNARANGSVQPATSVLNKNQIQPALPSQNSMPQTNGGRTLTGTSPSESTAILALLPMNGTFERKQINVPFFPDVLRVGRQTNAKTVPTPTNGFFDSKVLSRQHAEVWAERNGKVWIRDVKSSNGTFVNGQRLSPESRESEPHELRQHDTLELGIDIVSEDQKTIVHHKVSAKVEYVGLPGSSNNVLDLSFGDLDPSHGGSLLASPMSSPMTHSRSRPGGPIINGRSGPSSAAGSQMSSVPPQRQLNFWGAPLNVEQLVKSLSTEMRAAKQQMNDLEQAGSLLNSVLSSDPNSTKNQSLSKDGAQIRQPNGKVKPPRPDHLARFADPPAPPPQQPLPEKPDSAKSSPVSTHPISFTNILKRSETAKPGTSLSNSPTNQQNSQMLQLVEALSVAKKELDSQAARVKQLEDMLNEERNARADAEERARRLEQNSTGRPVTVMEETSESSSSAKPSESANTDSTETSLDRTLTNPEQQLSQRLEHMVAEMQRMKMDMDKYQRRADSAEEEAKNARESLAEMIERLRRENSKEAENSAGSDGSSRVDEDNFAVNSDSIKNKTTSLIKANAHANGHIRSPKLPEHLERAVTTVLREGQYGSGEGLAQSAPYVSLLGVVLIGVGVMAYLNSWQKSEQ